MDEEVSKILVENEVLFWQRWGERAKERGYRLEVAEFTPEVQKRHRLLWLEVLKALGSNNFEGYLKLIEQEGRLQARAYSPVEALVKQLVDLMNLIWEVVTASPLFMDYPGLLRPLTSKINQLRTQAEAAIMKGFLEEGHKIEERQALESVQLRKVRLEGNNLRDLIKSVRAFRMTRYHAGHDIFGPEATRGILFFVMEGRVRLYQILPDGREITFSILNAGEVFAQTDNRETYSHDVCAETMLDTTLAFIKESEIDNLMEESPQLASQIVKSFSQQLSQSQEIIEGLIGRDVSVRVVSILLKLVDEFGSSVSGYTHQELADMIGSNRVTVTRKLTELQKRQLIKVGKGSIAIINKQALEELVA